MKKEKKAGEEQKRSAIMDNDSPLSMVKEAEAAFFQSAPSCQKSKIGINITHACV
ncbi:hypothetical protein [Desulfonatronovibrio magnus]|uniref:hypothetical protein n=1 Tax=Desulfonatronovibrio magnus TaxID=698827 RepID=UPI0012F8B9BD|nr:hypothetical protein [Desulfonatronovibrio magnus]